MANGLVQRFSRVIAKVAIMQNAHRIGTGIDKVFPGREIARIPGRNRIDHEVELCAAVEFAEIPGNLAIESIGTGDGIDLQHVQERGQHIGEVADHDDRLQSDRLDEIPVGREGLHVNVRHGRERAIVKAASQDIGEIERAVAAALGMRYADQAPVDGVYRGLAEIRACTFGCESQKQKRAARPYGPEIVSHGRFEAPIGERLGEYRLNCVVIDKGCHFNRTGNAARNNICKRFSDLGPKRLTIGFPFSGWDQMTDLSFLVIANQFAREAATSLRPGRQRLVVVGRYRKRDFLSWDRRPEPRVAGAVA